ncbi:hypothetical protein GAYE_SCF68G6949 [Galdieria yellowstonensis]|uniref:Uncharacterized protein n=1 Tax=Galdieria yellowstonensis TaxID=3028027 RepID=A0AAV9IP13_9RHOD|nr:hypothetical protein GAYE_SCF68G6949 [Galdieria yellowstonensis]
MSALPPLFGVSQDSPEIFCTSLITCFLIRGVKRRVQQLKTVFACRDCKFSVVEKLNSQSAAHASACRVANSTIDDAVTFFASCASFGSLSVVKLLNKEDSVIHL